MVKEGASIIVLAMFCGDICCRDCGLHQRIKEEMIAITVKQPWASLDCRRSQGY